MKVFIAGPFTLGDTTLNVRDAMLAGIQLIDAGHAPFVPHLCHFLHMLSPHSENVWREYDFEWLETCHALIRLPGESAGADKEVEVAETLGIPVFYSAMEFLDYHDEGCPCPACQQ